jgi:hypothetical protein
VNARHTCCVGSTSPHLSVDPSNDRISKPFARRKGRARCTRSVSEGAALAVASGGDVEPRQSRKSFGPVTGDRGFESGSLQRGVTLTVATERRILPNASDKVSPRSLCTVLPSRSRFGSRRRPIRTAASCQRHGLRGVSLADPLESGAHCFRRGVRAARVLTSTSPLNRQIDYMTDDVTHERACGARSRGGNSRQYSFLPIAD